ncbi:MAG TPA: oligopeptidase B, partial [Gammaproteobacteria bacterium]|nr:oligopeptidase B [Gammaproteobacteria bacterium]
YALSVDQHYLAYTLDTQGDEFYTLIIKDLRDPTAVMETLQGVGDEVVFAADTLHFWYVRLDAAHRPYQIWQHQLHTLPAQDILIYHETDERFFIAPGRTKDNALLLVESHSKLSSEIHYTCANKPTLPLHCVFPRAPHIEYAVEHHQGDLIICTNIDAENFQIIRTPLHALDKKNWQIMLAHNTKIALEDFEVMQDFIVVHERRDGLPALHVLSFDGKKDYLIEVNDPTYSLDFGDNWLTQSNILRFEYESLTTPPSVYDFDLNTKERTLIKQTEVAHFNAQDYVSERLFAKAIDGTAIPISIVYKKTDKKPAPLFLTAYGAYGSIEDVWFSNARLSLIERGFVFAIAHI